MGRLAVQLIEFLLNALEIESLLEIFLFVY
jgi:hypothetical protein